MIIIINAICLTIIPAKYSNTHWPVTCKLLLTASISKMCKQTNQHSFAMFTFISDFVTNVSKLIILGLIYKLFSICI